jgi:hypothetical protein
MQSNRFCVFCGEKPTAKNNEHVIPQWLIHLTGNPNRVVNFGFNYQTNKNIKFSWSQFVVPACESCNNYYSSLEGEAKTLITRLLNRESISARNWMLLLDWLDKVRIGIWIAYHLIQKNPTGITPHLHVNSRIGAKDRMVCMYTIQTNNIGLKAFGVESLVFHRTPSCFALMINNIVLLNVSCDYLFAGRCGFPYPRNRYVIPNGIDQGKLSLTDFVTTRMIQHPLMPTKFIKPSIHLYQPIMQRGLQNSLLGECQYDSFLICHTIREKSDRGVLFRQFTNRAEPLFNQNHKIESDIEIELQPVNIPAILSQVYDFQNHCYTLNELLCDSEKEAQAILLEYNKKQKEEFLEQCKNNKGF